MRNLYLASNTAITLLVLGLPIPTFILVVLLVLLLVGVLEDPFLRR